VQIIECELSRLQIPFRRVFQHASASRSHGDAIIVAVITDQGISGFGEIQARAYVTGENNDDIWQRQAAEVATWLVGRSFSSGEDIYRQFQDQFGYEQKPALVGGFDCAVLDAFELQHGLDWNEIFGPARRTPTTKCLTVGSDIAGIDLKGQARIARLGGYSVVKLKVATMDDVARVRDLREWLGSGTAIRLDANGTLSLQLAIELLTACSEYDIESIEEPLQKGLADHCEAIVELYAATRVPIVADESVCTVADVARVQRSGAYQIINIRVGKCGGISGTARVLEAARKAGYELVSGTMVGETSVLLRASLKMLEYCDQLTYIEGIDQSKKLLLAQAIVPLENDARSHFEWLAEIRKKYAVDRKIIH
jgi:L-alanine-DL-glutamate epimerase-like enolase superfamily enzyme